MKILKRNQKRISILSIIFLVMIVDGAVIYTPKGYQYVLDRNVRRILLLSALITILTTVGIGICNTMKLLVVPMMLSYCFLGFIEVKNYKKVIRLIII